MNSETPPVSDTKRALVCVLLDCSESMGWYEGKKDAKPPASVDGKPVLPIDQLSAAVGSFLSDDLTSVGQLRRHGEVAIGLFRGTDESVDWQTLSSDPVDAESDPFYRVERKGRKALQLPKPLEASGQTPMGTAIMEGLKYIEERRDDLRQPPRPVQIPHRPSLFLLTDGRSEGETQGRLEEAREELQRAERGGKIQFWSVGTDGADMDALRSLSIGGSKTARNLKGMPFSDVLRLISQTPGRAAEAGYTNSVEDTYTNVDDWLTKEQRAFYDATGFG